MKKILLFICLLFMGVSSVSALSTTAYYDVLTKNITATQVANYDHDREQTSILKKELDAVMNCNLSTSGSYGTSTVNCVKAFQRAYNLTVTGYVNTSTRTKLNEVYKMNSMIVIKNGINVRSGASFSSSVLGKVNKGYIVKVISRKNVDGKYWVKFYYNGKYGYIYEENNLEGTFIEIEIVSQTMRFYKNRALYVDTPIVTGRKGRWDTLKGYFIVTEKAPNPTSYAQYGINIGGESGQFIHDYVKKRGKYASYTTYGGEIYKTLYDSNGNFIPDGDPRVGSLGCVNTPLQRIKPIYQNVKGANLYPNNPTPIYVH